MNYDSLIIISMNGLERLHSFRYRYLEGPLSLDRLQAGPTEGNCRLAIQDYFYTIHGLYLSKEDVVLPEAHHNGVVVKDFNGDANTFFENLQVGDVIYAERLRDSVGRKFKLGKGRYVTEDEWFTNLHMGVYLGTPTKDTLLHLPAETRMDRDSPTIWHASFIAGGTALWPIDKFCYYYQPVIAKRLLM